MLFRLWPSSPECLPQSLMSSFGPPRMENFVRVPDWQAPARQAPALLQTPPWLRWFIKKVGNIPHIPTPPWPGIPKVEREAGRPLASPLANSRGWGWGGWKEGSGPPERLSRQSQFTALHKQWRQFLQLCRLGTGPEPLRCLHPGLFHRTINAYKVCRATCF